MLRSQGVELEFRQIDDVARGRGGFTQSERSAGQRIPCPVQVTLKNRLQIHAPGLTPTAVLEKLGTIQMINVCIPTCDGRWLILPRHTQPAQDLQVLLDQIQMSLPAQSPPRITAPVPPTAAHRTAAQPCLW